MTVGNESSRLELLRKNHEEQPEDIHAATDLAQYYADRGWYDKSIAVYEVVLKTSPDNYSLLLDYGNVSFRQENFSKALDAFKKLTVLKPQRVEAWNNLGIANLKLGNNDAARLAFEQVLSLEPDNPGALLNMGNYHQAKGELDKAVEMFKRAVAARLDFGDGWFDLGNAYVEMGTYPEAIEAFRKCLRYLPELSSAYKNLGYCYEQTDSFAQALQNYGKALSLNKADAGIYVNIGNVLTRQGDYEAAKKNYLSSVKLSPRGMSGWMGLRHLSLLRGDVESFSKATLAVLQRLESDTVAESLRVLRELKHPARVDEILDAADAAGTAGDALDAERLLAYQRRGDRPGKVSALQKRLAQLTPMPDGVARGLAEFYLEQKDFDKTALYASKAQNRDLSTMRMLWISLIAKQEWKPAEQSAREYLREHPDCFECWYYLARIRGACGDDAEAEECLLKALEGGFSDITLIDDDPVLRRIRTAGAAAHLSDSWEKFAATSASPSSARSIPDKT